MAEKKECLESESLKTTAAKSNETNAKMPLLHQEFATKFCADFLESMTDGFWVLDQEWRCIYINKKQTQLLGISQAEILGQNFWELFPETVDSVIYTKLHQVITEQIAVKFTYYQPKLQRWLECRAYPSASAVYILTFDITEQQIAIIEQAQCTSDRQREERRKAAQYAVTRVLAEATTLVAAVPAILQSLCESLGWQLGVIWQVDHHHNVLRHVNSWQSPTSNLQTFIEENQQTTFAPSIGLPGRIWVSHQPAWISKISEESNFTRAATAIKSGLNTVFGFPILLGDEILGVIECFSDRIQAPDEDLLQMMATIGSQIGQFMERKRTEAALRESEENLRLTLEAARMVAWTWDASTNIIKRSATACDVLKLPAEMLTGSGEEGWELVHPDDLPQHQAKVEEAIATGNSYASEFRILHPITGEIIWVEDRGQVNCNQTGKLTGLKGALLNISDRKQVETALREREERFSTLFNGMEDWVLVYHLTSNFQPGQFIEVNEQACKKLGYDREELLKMSVTQIIGSSSINAQANIARLLVEKHIVVESVHTTKDGRRLPVEVSATLFKLNGLPTIQAICRDITERKQAEAEREQLLKQEQAAREEAEAANRIKDEFLAVLSHELRTPLNPILGWTQMLRTRKLDGEATNRALATIERNAKLQTQLIEDLLDISRILRGKIVLNVAPVNLTTTIEAALETVRLAAEAKNIRVQTKFSPDVRQVSGDAARLQQVVWNLLSNAIKFTPDSGQVEICLEQVGKYAQIQVTDTGKGISSEFLPYVFEYFRQEDSTTTRKFGGLGLGLAIARHITELHGGTVKVESPGQNLGTTFTIRLPVIANALTQIQDDEQTSLQNLNLNQLKILAVDDDADMRDLIVAILTIYGAEVKVAASAVEALTLLENDQPDVIISDIGMPDINGYTLIRQIKTQMPEQYRKIPAIALTAYAGEYDQRQALDAGFQLHLAKPVVPEELIRAIALVVITGKR